MDGGVLGLLQPGGRDVSGLAGLSCVEQPVGAQQATDVLGSSHDRHVLMVRTVGSLQMTWSCIPGYFNDTNNRLTFQRQTEEVQMEAGTASRSAMGSGLLRAAQALDALDRAARTASTVAVTASDEPIVATYSPDQVVAARALTRPNAEAPIAGPTAKLRALPVAPAGAGATARSRGPG